jgi:hypothetical protein
VGEGAEGGQSFENALAQAAHHRSAMVERRNIGLRIVVGVVTFDVIVLKLALDATDSVSDHSELAWAIRLIAAGAFVVLAGMLLQLEGRNRRDRVVYRAAEQRADAIRLGKPASQAQPEEESIWYTIRQSWATTWTLGGVFILTIAIWWLAGLLTHQHPRARPNAVSTRSSWILRNGTREPSPAAPTIGECPIVESPTSTWTRSTRRSSCGGGLS